MHETARSDRSSPAPSATSDRLDETGFRYDTVEAGGAVVVSMQGELDLASAPSLQRNLSALLVDRPVTRMTLDLGALTFVDSSGLGALYNVRQAASARGAAFRLEAVPDHVLRVLDVTGMTSLFEINRERGSGR